MAANHVSNTVLKRELDIGTKVTNLEKKAGQLEKDFNEMLMAAREMQLAVRKYVKKAEIDQKSWEILEKLTDTDVNVSDVLDHVRIFFSFILAKMQMRRAELTDVKMLWHLLDCEGVSQCFNDVMIQCGFARDDFENMKTLLSLVSKMQEEMERRDVAVENVNAYASANRDIAEVESQCLPANMIADHDSVNNKGIKEPEIKTPGHDTESAEILTLNKDLQNGVEVLDNKLGAENGNITSFIVEDIGEKQNCDGTFKKLREITDKGLKGGPIREALKRVKFLDIEDDLKKLIKKIVSYVTKVTNE